MPQFAIPVSTLEDLARQYRGRRIKTTKLNEEEEFGKIAATVLLGGAEGSNPTALFATNFGKIGFLVETDSGVMEVWTAGTLVPHRQLPVERTLLDDVQTGELTTAKFAEIVGIPLDIAEGLIEVYGNKAASQT